MDADASPAAAALHEIADGVFAWMQPDGTWWINNAGAVTAIGGDGTHDGGTVVVDTCATHERTRRFLDAVAAATGRRRSRWRSTPTSTATTRTATACSPARR